MDSETIKILIELLLLNEVTVDEDAYAFLQDVITHAYYSDDIGTRTLWHHIEHKEDVPTVEEFIQYLKRIRK